MDGITKRNGMGVPTQAPAQYPAQYRRSRSRFPPPRRRSRSRDRQRRSPPRDRSPGSGSGGATPAKPRAVMAKGMGRHAQAPSTPSWQRPAKRYRR
jgi:hypothetical protein